jgi:hypothetical protein
VAGRPNPLLEFFELGQKIVIAGLFVDIELFELGEGLVFEFLDRHGYR